MSRTIELGRAVVCSQNAKLELWLTTLITLSPSQGVINLQNFSENGVIKLLSSGNTWVGRADGMQMLLDITVHREPLASNQLRQLANSIISAPAWKQLNLRPSLPIDPMATDGKLHINIGQCRYDASLPAKKGHHVGPTVPSSDANPPEGVPILSLQSVHCAMVITESRSRVTATRPMRAQPRSDNIRGPYEDAVAYDHVADQDSEMLFEAGPEVTDELHAEIKTAESRLPRLSLRGRKRKRPYTVPNERRHMKSSCDATPRSKRNRPSTFSTAPVAPLDAPAFAELQQVETMIDAGLRISVSNSLRGSSGGLKIKANTFTEGLADVAPALWRPGYLLALSQRTHLVSTLSLSLGRASLRAKSGTLQTQISALTSPVIRDAEYQIYPILINGLEVNRVSSSAAARIWLHTQKILLSKPFSAAVQPFCSFWSPSLDQVDADEILEESRGRVDEDGIEFPLDDILGMDRVPCDEPVIATGLAHEDDRLLDDHFIRTASIVGASSQDELLSDSTCLAWEGANGPVPVLPMDQRSGAPSGPVTPDVRPTHGVMGAIDRTAAEFTDNPHSTSDDILFEPGSSGNGLISVEQGRPRFVEGASDEQCKVAVLDNDIIVC
ncbi:hypothetical protein K458DRAFT_381993 [Lentithecium fluviatile CBS 122367]|uniref:Uncharacterized protein n=1 Tax=Lentithecium fluviatile CBS 122367 TaxID=1168545 RepID=A0A6G1JNV1_9PLEO|nr:hypothetical protein K458DRAFT_381993 [Lentithecium fluviatile CBS 122367]